MAPLDRLALVSCFVMALAALGIAIYAVYEANKVRTTFEEYRTNQVHRERRQRDLGPPRGTGERRHAHPDATLRARRRDQEAPRFEQREPTTGPETVSGASSANVETPPRRRHRAPDTEDEALTDEQIAAQPAEPKTQQMGALPRPGAIRREQ